LLEERGGALIVAVAVLALSIGLILYHFAGYYLLLKVLILFRNDRVAKHPDNKEFPLISVIVTAHNEERTIRRKIENTLSLDYPSDRFEVILADDWSEDGTVNAVNDFILEGRIRYFKPDKHMGKTYAQNGAVREANGDIIAFSDANSYWETDVLRRFAKSFQDTSVGFVAGALRYTGINETPTSQSRGLYWNYELKLRSLESIFLSIVTSNGAIYAIKRNLYCDADPLYSHDSFMPPYIVSLGRKAVFDSSIVANEKIVKDVSKEYSRRVRIFGRMYKFLFDKTLWRMLRETESTYRLMFFSHRILRLLLPMLSLLSIATLISIMILYSPIHVFLIFLIFASVPILTISKIRNVFFHYSLTIVAMTIGFYNYITGKIKPYWEPVDDGR